MESAKDTNGDNMLRERNKLSIERIDHKVHLSYRDVLLVPYDDDFCEILSRNDPDISSEVCPGKKIDIPIVSSPMDTVTGPEMADKLAKLGCLGVLTRYINDPDEITKQVANVKYVKERNPEKWVACAIGVKTHVYDHVKQLCDVGMNIVCLDIANGNHIYMKNALEEVTKLKDEYDLSIIAGNVATGKSALRLAEYGADCIKVGVGSGAVCSTRRVTGYGVPQLTAIMDCYESLWKAGIDICIMADGGIRHSGDAIKSYWGGGDTVMCGYLFAGHNECPVIDGEKIYRGMSSRNVSRRSDIAAEGVCIKIENKGSVEHTVKEWAAAIRAGLSMGNAENILQLRANVSAIRVSTMSNSESDPVSES